MLGPLRLRSPDDVRRVYEAFLKPISIRDALVLIASVVLQEWQSSTEQVIYDIAFVLKEAGVLRDGELLADGTRTRAWLDRLALDAWFAATMLILSEDV